MKKILITFSIAMLLLGTATVALYFFVVIHMTSSYYISERVYVFAYVDSYYTCNALCTGCSAPSTIWTDSHIVEANSASSAVSKIRSTISAECTNNFCTGYTSLSCY